MRGFERNWKISKRDVICKVIKEFQEGVTKIQ